jgi:parallel beta-helix repeat protein
MKRTAYFSLGVVALVLTLGPSAGAQPIFVDDDGADCVQATCNTIQAAVDAASPGATILVCPGTYVDERVVLTAATNNLQLIAVGAPGTVLLDGTNNSCAIANNHGFLLNGASSVLVQGFALIRYCEEIRLTNANGNTIRRNMMTEAGHDGITLVASSGNLIEHNTAFDNPSANACGINIIGGSTNNLVRNNVVENNEWGIQIAGPPTTGNVVFHNSALDNRGNGIRNVGGASGTVIEGNRAFRNGLDPGPNTGATNAGIRIESGADIRVVRNHAFDNQLVDIRSDVAPGAATFENNHCVTSDPFGLCAHSEGASN